MPSHVLPDWTARRASYLRGRASGSLHAPRNLRARPGDGDEVLAVAAERSGLARDTRPAKVIPQVRPWPAAKRLHMVHHADVAQALLLALAADGVDGRAYNVADDAPVTAADLLRLGGQPAPEEAAGLAPSDPWEGIVDTARIRDDLGFRPVYPSVFAARDAGAL